MGNESKNTLTMEEPRQETLSFGKKKGCFVSQSLLILAFCVFVGAIVATGVLVYVYKPALEAEVIGLGPKEEYRLVNPKENEIKTADVKHKTKDPMMKKKILPDVRLPLDLNPQHYHVRLQPFINGNLSIEGYVEMTFKVLKETNQIVLHINDMITKNDTVMVYMEGHKNHKIPVMNHKYDQERQFYIATLKKYLEKGKTYIIAMEYIAKLSDHLDGFYHSSYKTKAGEKVMLATTQFQPTDARKAFPCMDEPALKAKFTIEMIRENRYSSISNMPIATTNIIEDQPGWSIDLFETSVPMSTYLVAFAVTDFDYVTSRSTNNKNNVKYRVWARKEAIDQTEYAKSISPPITEFFENFFSVPFPLPKQDQIALPDFSAGAMENWGLITYRESALLYNPSISTSMDKQWIGEVVAHELGHQWFGNLVTPSWWTDLWLNEGFASYLQYLGLNSVEPSALMMDQFAVNRYYKAFDLDALESSHPISIPVQHPNEISEIFDTISYEKGASIIRMMSHFLHEETFRKGLTVYLNKFKYKSAEQDDLWLHLTQQAHKDGTLDRSISVKSIMDTWTLQMGFPVITVSRQKNDGTATLTQERFYLVKNANSSDTHDYKWWVPITFTSQNKANFSITKPKEWMRPEESAKVIDGVPPTNQWVIFNLQQTGYYRVNYDIQNWNALADQLLSDYRKIPATNRAQIIDDSFNFARAGLIQYEIPFKLISYLKFESHYVPFKSAVRNLEYVHKMLLVKGGYGSLKKFMLDFIVPMYNEVGFQGSENEDLLIQHKRSLILNWACKLDHQPCIQEALKLYKKWMNHPNDYATVSPNLKSVVYCAAISEGGEKEWSFAWDRFQNANVAVEKVKLLYAMGCSKKTWILSNYMSRAFNESLGIRKQDGYRVIGSITSNVLGRQIAWVYLRDRWPHILEYYGKSSFTLNRCIKLVTESLNTNVHIAEMEQFMLSNKGNFGSATKTVIQSKEKIQNNVAWVHKNYQSIYDWLDQNNYKNSI